MTAVPPPASLAPAPAPVPVPPIDATRHRRLADLESALAALPAPPRDSGRLDLVVCRLPGERRQLPDRVLLTPAGGVVGDRWAQGRSPDPAEQVAVMRADVARLMAHGQPLGLFGDNFFVDLDLSCGNVPPGSRLRVGDALVEVTPEPHDGCSRFRRRFGADALRFVWTDAARALRLRGVYWRVVESGTAGPGDRVQVVSRPGAG